MRFGCLAFHKSSNDYPFMQKENYGELRKTYRRFVISQLNELQKVLVPDFEHLSILCKSLNVPDYVTKLNRSLSASGVTKNTRLIYFSKSGKATLD